MSIGSVRHPLYDEQYETWRFLRNAYLGGQYWYEAKETHKFEGLYSWDLAEEGEIRRHPTTIYEHGYLVRHPREHDEDYMVRRRLSVYRNFMRREVDLLATAVTRGAKRPELPAELAYLHDDVDGQGTNLQDFRRAMATWAIVFGHVWVVVDRPAGEVQPSLLHEQLAGVRPYARIVTPLDVVRWRLDRETRRLQWALLVEEVPYEDSLEARAGSGTGPPPMRYSYDTWRREFYRYWSPEEWVLYRGDEELERGAGYGFVPLFAVFSQRAPTVEPVGLSPVRDAAELGWLLYNKASWKTDEEAAACFNQVFLETEEKLKKETQRVLSLHRYVSGAKSMSFVSPDVSTMQHLGESMEQDLEWARYIIGTGTEGEKSRAAKSGIALQLERENLNALLAGYAASFEGGEQSWLSALAVLAGGSASDVRSEWSRDFSGLDISARAQQIAEAVPLYTGRAKAVLLKRLHEALLPDEPERDEVNRDIDAASADEAR